ncbi:hypothetical protein LTR66_000679 [Elasticomyces elasticus]|nr:hypothetical protein LTR66_000679 [Elasticomyces elasticus]
MSIRTFREVGLLVTGVQDGQSRLRSSRSEEERIWPVAWPAVCRWKCNLTGLSKTRNLYFVAYVEQIYVYCPQFPEQSLPKEPALIINTPPSKPGLAGWNDRERPHAINNLVVEFLGNDEVLAVVRDDGDVQAYRVREIFEAVQRRKHPVQQLASVADEVAPFFERNVDASAWGLAIHSEARMIAVSSNHHQVTIFIFALVQNTHAEHRQVDVVTEEVVYTDSNPQNVPPLSPANRQTSQIRTILGLTTNVPDIAFCNNDRDPLGRWLATTDISGYTKIWDIHRLVLHEGFTTTPDGRRLRDGFDAANAGWGVMFLDTKSFAAVTNVDDALGLYGAGKRVSFARDWCLDITDARLDVNDAGKWFVPGHERRTGTDNNVSAAARASNDTNQDEPVGEVEASGDFELSDYVEDEEEDEEDLSETESGEDGYVSFSDSDAVPIGPRSGSFAIAGFAQRRSTLPCPLLGISVRQVVLVQSSEDQNSTQSHCPIITIHDPLHQYLHGDIVYLNHFDRLNMHTEIPELGIVVVASQKGRAAIFSLTQCRTRVSKIRDRALVPKSEYKQIYAFRLDHILPLRSQELAGLRPVWPLYGLAAGPVQGTESLPSPQKRWRLMMMYQDHSILTYELGKSRNGELSMQSLIV